MSMIMLLAAAAAPPSGPPAVTHRDLRAVAIIQSARHRASGFLVGPCTALTARHVIGAQVRGEQVKVSLPLLGRSTRAYVVDPGAGFDGTPVSFDGGDWAVLRLDKCLGHEAGYFPLAGQMVPGRNWVKEWGTAVVAGYPQYHDWRTGPYVDPICSINDATATHIQSNCTAWPGHSGSPLLQWQRFDGHWRLVAVGIIVTGQGKIISPSATFEFSDAVPIGQAMGTKLAEAGEFIGGH